MTKNNHFWTVVAANISFILVDLGMICFTCAAFALNFVAGLIVAGVMLIILAYILQPQQGGE
ncbi:hypothetical protein [Liquorilactobacillus satsumensis]|uniref:Uncharacterized protein n=1 Tax=Liquorilactobacillus satsumensis DSM 16230 = JCM 12392 TaxID=1423801 RepID=A0A0R1V292_9LACO|nr:hypothetical protein [Liquorilactobacillus satsumensis]KRL99753.1 hypothetical protein FD50_GL000073 [Liquorilactobacillus satsumensis DSM 16230 = JCM 12392]